MASDEFVKAMHAQFEQLRRDLELSLSRPSFLSGVWAVDALQDSIPQALDTEGMDGADPWSR